MMKLSTFEIEIFRRLAQQNENAATVNLYEAIKWIFENYGEYVIKWIASDYTYLATVIYDETNDMNAFKTIVRKLVYDFDVMSVVL